MLFLLEAALVAAALGAALSWPARWGVPLGGLRAFFARRLAGRPWLQALVVLALAGGLRGVLLPVLGPPAPFVADEFSIILQAETFALGRLANPTHPLFAFFETIYVNQLPSYASMYFPGRGAPLALGILVGGHPWPGVWLSMALLAAATTWMLRAWVPESLALLGGILVVVRYGVLSGWINSYYGGGFVALGGVLVLGAFPRLVDAPRWRDGLAFAAGLVILMTSRPFEGLFFALPLMVGLAGRLLASAHRGDFAPMLRVAVPTAIIAGAGVGLMLAYNVATTGNLLEDPYTHNRLAYAHTSAFFFEGPIEPTHVAPEQVDTFYQEEAAQVHPGFVGLSLAKVMRAVNFYLGPVFFIPFLIGLVLAYRRPVLWVSAAALMVSFLLSTWYWAHYLAPGFGLFWLFIFLGLAGLSGWRWRDRPTGQVLATFLACIAVVSLALPVAALPFRAREQAGASQAFVRPCCALLTETPRTRIEGQLRASPGRDLVFFRYDRHGQDKGRVMVANGPDIDAADIVWAHDLGPANQRLIERYPDRAVWLVTGTVADRAVPYAARQHAGK